MQGSAVSPGGLNLLEALVYGLIQGVTEFLPVSSSGHLVLAHRIGLGALPPHLELPFDVLLHGATLIAIGIAFRSEIAATLHWRPKLWLCIVISILPAGVAGLLGRKYVVAASSHLELIGVFYLFTATLLIISERISTKKSIAESTTAESTGATTSPPAAKQLDNITIKQAVTVGALQVFALLPGISRSGSTISAGLLAKMPPRLAVAYSFLVGIPLIAAATAKDAFDGGFSELASQVGPLALGVAFFTALLSGLASIKVLKLVVRKRRLVWFGAYCSAVAIACFLLAAR